MKMNKLNPRISMGMCFFHLLVFLVGTSKHWFPVLNRNRVALLSSTIIICIGYLIYDLIVNRPHIKENNQIRTKNMDRIAGDIGMVTAVVREGPTGGQKGCELVVKEGPKGGQKLGLGLGLRRRQVYGETERMEKLQSEIEELGEHAKKMKEEYALFTSRTMMDSSKIAEDVYMYNLNRVQKANKELVAKLEEVEKDKKIAVEGKIKLMKILDEQTRKVSCLDNLKAVNKELVAKLEEAEKGEKIAVESKIVVMKILDEEMKKVPCLDDVQKVNKELVAKLEEVEKDKKLMVESRIELMKILDEEKKKVLVLEQKCVNLEKGIELHRIAYRERETSYKPKLKNLVFNKKLVDNLTEYEKRWEEDLIECTSLSDEIESRKNGLGRTMKFESMENKKGKEVVKRSERERLIEKLTSVKERVEKTRGTKADSVKNKVETDMPVNGNTGEHEDDTMFGSEGDTVYVDFDGMPSFINLRPQGR